MGRPRSWSDDDLAEAVAGASNLAEVVRRLRLAHGGAAYVTVRTRIEQLEIDTSHFTTRSREPSTAAVSEASHERTGGARRSWTDAELAEAVAASESLNGVFSHLGLKVGGSQWLIVRARISALSLPTEHWKQPLGSTPRRTAVDQLRAQLLNCDLRAMVKSCSSRAELLRSVGLAPGATSYKALGQAFELQGIEPAELNGWQRAGGRPRRPLRELLVADSHYTNTGRLRERLVEEGLLEPRCVSCGIDTWCGQPAPLQLDHVNGDRRDNRLENLRMLCPNCHAQTPTYCARNKGRYGGEEGGDAR